MTGVSLGLRTGSYGSLQSARNVGLQANNGYVARRTSRASLSASRDKERWFTHIRRFIGRKEGGMLILFIIASFFWLAGFFTVYRDTSESGGLYFDMTIHNINSSKISPIMSCGEENIQHPPLLQSSSTLAFLADSLFNMENPCNSFAFPPPPPGDRRRYGPRPCPVCYLPVEQAMARMPRSPSLSPVLQHLTYYHQDHSITAERHGGSKFGGYPSLKLRNDSFKINESMTVHCGFVKGCRPGFQTGFDIDENDIRELQQFHEVIVASAIFGNYDIIQQPRNIGDFSRKNIRFYMFIDEATEAYMRNSSILDSTRRVGLWRIIIVHNTPYGDARRNGKVPKLLLHRLFPNIRYSIWIDAKLQLVVDPYQVLERFLWRQNATFAISKHYRRYDVFEEAEANKAAGKYDNVSIDYQVDFYKKEGLTPYSEAKLPIISDVPEGCVIIKEHIPITNLFTCLWFNEVDRFTSRDQLSFSSVRDKFMAQVNWSVNMFLDCERRNFVIQGYHRDILAQMSPPPPPSPPAILVRHSPPPPATSNNRGIIPITTRKIPVKKTPARRGRDRRSGSRRHRKVGNRDNTF
ncbi:probable hexosyltransferase MUCI70 [Impatiens glandulifera]|uniref:probable hexosyltransferase MUCI70 n=1 Tax=Impatiens glandulifera TaxID=253017 RepID=UPI001FB0E4DE|nr:probable hexosyltransferase MUCI70 [Impatiens glandulifera]XP_047311731.1 probable hexosyltransferase MUCI70 [Impatiens glandulifera]XP_047311732.1 probable hexosyltransferase MUCI70 [Impatiens glandulifera]XP_047311733.1 probable hexosyltransferase MUCI70 [Impatiens glandulifera]